MKYSVCIAIAMLLGQVGGMFAATFSRDKEAVQIRFPNGAHITVKLDGDNVLGITQVDVSGTPLRCPSLAIHPVLKLADGQSYASCRLESVEEVSGATILRCKLKPKQGDGEDSLDWIFEPRNATVRDRSYVGFAYRYEFRSSTRKLDEILDIATWEVGGRIDGKFVQPGRLATKANSFFSRAGRWRNWTFLSTPWFRFQCGGDGMLYDVYEEVGPIQSWLEKRSDCPLLYTFDKTLQELKTSGGTPFRRIMFCGHKGSEGLQCVDEYTKVFDHLEKYVRDQFGIGDPQYIPIVKVPQRRDHTFELRIEDLAEIAELGFKGIWMATFESVRSKLQGQKRLNAHVFSLDPAEILGGAAGLGKLVAAAHRHDIKVYTWGPGGQLAVESDVLKAHPEWLWHAPQQKIYKNLGYTDLHGGYYDYAIGKYRDLHQATDIDGIWFDSFNLASTAQQFRPDGSRYFQIRRAFQMVADTQKAGIANVQLEAAGPAGQDACPSGEHPQVVEPSWCYKRAMYFTAARPDPVNYYYRWIANKAFPMMPLRCMLWTYEYKSLADFPELRQQVRRANLDWAAVEDLMVNRRLIAAEDDPWKDVGVEWTKPGSTARGLFSYGRFSYPVPAGAKVTDVSTGDVVTCQGNVLQTKCCHTYRIEHP